MQGIRRQVQQQRVEGMTSSKDTSILGGTLNESERGSIEEGAGFDWHQYTGRDYARSGRSSKQGQGIRRQEQQERAEGSTNSRDTSKQGTRSMKVGGAA